MYRVRYFSITILLLWGFLSNVGNVIGVSADIALLEQNNNDPDEEVITTSAVTYTLSSGRLGDNLLSYLHAKWIAYVYDIPLLYKPFNYSDQLALHDVEKLYTAALEKQFKKVVTVSMPLMIDKYANILYVVPYFPESLAEHTPESDFLYFITGWDDLGFQKIIRTVLQPKNQLILIKPPQNCMSVAVHVRVGRGYDFPEDQSADDRLLMHYPLKFVPDSYYIEQIQEIVRIFSDQPLYVYLFTDDPQPGALLKKYKQALNNNNVTFACRMKKNHHCAHVLEDFFSLLQFDCLIRSDSNFPLVASKLMRHMIHICPSHCYFHDNQVTVKGTITKDIEKIILHGGKI